MNEPKVKKNIVLKAKLEFVYSQDTRYEKPTKAN